MDNIKAIVAHNLAELRKNKKITQGELAERFNYSDKSVSKWEHGETVPDLETLQQLCDFYGVTLDYLTHEITADNKKQYVLSRGEVANKGVITALAVLLAWLIAILIAMATETLLGKMYWMAFIWAVPVSFLVMMVFNSLWGRKLWRPALVTMLGWTFLTSLYLELGFDLPENSGWSLWMLFLLGIPITAAAILWSHIKK